MSCRRRVSDAAIVVLLSGLSFPLRSVRTLSFHSLPGDVTYDLPMDHASAPFYFFSGQPPCASHLDAVLANPSGRCSWGDFLQNGIRRSPTTPSLAGEHGGRSKYDGSTLHVGMPLSTGPMEELLDAQDSPTEEAKITLPSSQHQAVGDPTESSKGEDAPEQLSLVLDLGSTTLREASIPQDVGELQIVASDQREREETSGSPATVAKLHMALEHLTRHGGKGGAGGLSITECAQFCTEWPRDCQLPTFFDRVLLQPAWSADEQVLSRKRPCTAKWLWGYSTFCEVKLKGDKSVEFWLFSIPGYPMLALGAQSC